MKAAALLALCLSALLAASAAAAPGDLDRSFGSGGLVHTDVGGTDIGNGVTLLPDGRVLAWGRSDVEPPFDARIGPGNEDFALARYAPSGRLDPRFGRGGRVTSEMGGQDRVTAVALQADGKLLAGGISIRGTAPHEVVVLARYGPDGRLDPSFGSGGAISTPVGRHAYPATGVIRLLDDGRILVATPTRSGPYPNGLSQIALLRFLPDGRPDPGWGDGGTKTAPFGDGTAGPHEFAVDAAGRLVVLGAEGGDLVVARYTPAGELDPSFGEAGRTVVSFGNLDYPGALALDEGGGILVSEEVDVTGSGMRLIRLDAGGRLDPAFGSHGSVDLAFPAHSLALDGSGRVVVGGAGFRMARYSQSGVRNERFVEARVPRRFRIGDQPGLAVQPDGRIMAVSYMIDGGFGDPYGPPPPFDFAVARFHGGDDARPPRIRLAGGRPSGCLRRRVVLRVRVRDPAFRGAFVARLDGRKLAILRRAGGPGYGVPVPVRKLRPGPHRLVLVARDASDNRAVLRVRLRRCR